MHKRNSQNDFFQCRILVPRSQKNIPKLRLLGPNLIGYRKRRRSIAKGHLRRHDTKHVSLCAIENCPHQGYLEYLRLFLAQALPCCAQHKVKSLQEFSLLKSKGKSLLHLPKVPGATHTSRYATITVNQTNYGHGESLFGNSFLEVKIRRQKTHLRSTLYAHDRLPIDQSQGQYMDYPVLSPLGQRPLSRLGISRKGTKRCLGKLVVQICHSSLVRSHCPCSFQSRYHRCWSPHFGKRRRRIKCSRNSRCHDINW